jgi:uncharacterized membrane protein
MSSSLIRLINFFTSLYAEWQNRFFEFLLVPLHQLGLATILTSSMALCAVLTHLFADSRIARSLRRAIGVMAIIYLIFAVAIYRETDSAVSLAVVTLIVILFAAVDYLLVRKRSFERKPQLKQRGSTHVAVTEHASLSCRLKNLTEQSKYDTICESIVPGVIQAMGQTKK